MTNFSGNSQDNSFRKEFDEMVPVYHRLAINLVPAIKEFLNSYGINYLDVIFRIKGYNSFRKKIHRKQYDSPMQQMGDLCGIRIICSYPSDIPKIQNIIKNEFNILQSIDKTDLLDPDKFGYRGLHYIVTIKEDWLSAPNYRGLKDVKAEIQIHTILMHAWADIEHKLAYKKEVDVPKPLKHQLSKLSALFEIADDQLDNLRKERKEYQNNLVQYENGEQVFDTSQPVNLDSLQAFLDFYFPDRYKSIHDTNALLVEVLANKFTFPDMIKSYNFVKEILPVIEKEAAQNNTNDRFSQVAVMREALALTHAQYWESKKPLLANHVVERITKWRNTILNTHQNTY